MKDFSLFHYYYGDRFVSFRTGLGSVIRAKGHSLNVSIIVIDDSFQWLKNSDIFANFDSLFVCIDDEHQIIKTMIQEKTEIIDNAILLIINFDLLIEEGIFSLQNFIDIMKRKRSTEIILTGENHYTEIEELASYVSYVKSIKN